MIDREKLLAGKRRYYESHKDEILKKMKDYRKNRAIQCKLNKLSWYEKNKDKILQNRKERYSQNREKILEEQKIRRERNPEIGKRKSSIYYEKNKDILNAKKREYYKNNKEKWKESRIKNRDSILRSKRIDSIVNAEKYRARANKWYHEHKDEPGFKELCKERKRKYYENGNGRMKMYLWGKTYTRGKGLLISRLKTQRRLARKAKIIHAFTKEEWEEKMKSTNGICPMCKRDVKEYNMTLDHIVPISKAKEGFVYTINDIQPLCMQCNASKCDNYSDVTAQ